MKIIYLDLQMGAAGDMLAGALLGLLDAAARDRVLDSLARALPAGVEAALLPAEQCGVTGLHFSVTVRGETEREGARHPREHAEGHAHHEHEEGHAHHEHEEGHAHHEHRHHAHAGMAEIERTVAAMKLAPDAAADVLTVYRSIAAAEGEVHGAPAELVHFHELGALDAVADVTAVTLALRELGAGRIAASAVAVGSGTVRCAHGVLPVPAPATALLLRGVPARAGDVTGELCTPTGAALIGHYVNEFGPMPALRIEGVSCGFGTKEFPGRPNCVRAILGEAFEDGIRAVGDGVPREAGRPSPAAAAAPSPGGGGKGEEGAAETVFELSCSIDDMTAEELGFALEQVRAAGALEAFTLAAGMKKDRPGTVLTALCRGEDRDAVLRALFTHTATLGVRQAALKRYVLDRETETVQTAFGPVRRKLSRGYGVEKAKWEYEDLARIAREEGMALDQLRRVLDADAGAD